MRNTLIAVIALGLAAGGVQAAELKIGIIDPIKAISDTEAYKQEAADLDKDLAGDKARFTKLSNELNVCKQKLGADAATMSATEQARMRTDCDTKYRDYQAIGQNLQKVISEREQAVLKDFGPKVQKAIEAVAKEGGYDAILTREALLFAKPELDVSAKITVKLNAMK